MFGVFFLVIFAVPLFLDPYWWADRFGWDTQPHTDVGTYLGRCLGALANALSDCAPLRGLLGSPLDPGTLREARQLAMSNGAVPSALDVARDHATKAGEAARQGKSVDALVAEARRKPR